MADEEPIEDPEPRQRSSAVLAQLRVDWVAELVLMGCQFRQINESIREEEANPESGIWFAQGLAPLSRRTILNYIEKANAQISETVQRNSAKIFDKHISRREWLYLKTVSVGAVPDYRAALAILQDLGKIEQVYPKVTKDDDEDTSSGEAQRLADAIALLTAARDRLLAPNPEPAKPDPKDIPPVG